MKKIIRLTESDLVRIVKRVIAEQSTDTPTQEELKQLENVKTMAEKTLLPKKFINRGSILTKDLYGMNVGGKGKRFATLSFYIDKEDNSRMFFEFNMNGDEQKVLVDLIPVGKEFSQLFQMFGKLSNSENVEQLKSLYDDFYELAEEYNTNNVLYK